MRRHQVRPFGHSISSNRTLSLLMSLAAIWMLYSWVRQPATWQWLAEVDDSGPTASVPQVEIKPGAVPAAPKENVVKETIVPGPNDLDPKEMKEFRSKLEALTDRAPIRFREMPLYWRLMEWSRTEPFKTIEGRADGTIAFAQIWAQPEHYRARLVRLRMHVRRVLRWDAPAENPLGLKHCYEIWGWTEDSKSHPYVIVVPELPPGLRIGPDVRGEIVFVGYFFKILPYEAFDVARGAPCLIGRIRQAAKPVAGEPLNSTSSLIMIASGIAIAICAGIAIRFLLMMWHRRPATMLPDSLDGPEAFSTNFSGRELPVTFGGEGYDEDLDESSGSGWVPDRS